MRLKRLYKSESDRKIAGICGGLGDYFNIDPTIIRIVFLILIIPANIMMILGYIFMMLVIPDESEVAS
ncbi:PspC domain-containing protein [Salisediminibacterium halotolerans]|uniref:Phage shock protein PspC (Stress-responsive transcriptional regulator) n=1 Tax=Salisediminibacterium halotolerans TaxID=517425 RepID=A0A1H9W1M2_9BACI|nr:PspC domain-containing protein [Salisediminibacterium haloalkalitolerans]SES27684.1 Phage shock protein PspC (stress-responsive transcriptional regulator) [Salisediminibacterium haloalkalitolerans]